MPYIKQFALVAALLFFCGIRLFGAADLAQLVEKPAELWEMSGTALLAKHKKNLFWADAGKTTLYCPGRSLKGFSWQGKPVYDLHFICRDDKVAAMTVVIYAKGDVGKAALNKDKFRELLKNTAADIRRHFPQVLLKKWQVKIGGTRAWVWSWSNKKLTARIKYAINDKEVPEFMTLEFLAPGFELGGASRSSMRSSTGRADAVKRINKLSNGDCYLIVPMVDQGSKGYCVPATLERVLNYYGIRIEQSTLAQMIGSDAARGTSMVKTVAKLREIDSRLGLTYIPRFVEDLNDPRQRNRLLNRYNRLARKDGKKRIKAGKDWLNSVDYAVLKKLRNQKGADRFFERIKADIDRGIPIFWSVILFPSDKTAGNQKKVGFHLRLITGYNAKTRTVIFSDSWGSGSEKKSLPLADAWTITQGTFVMTVRQR